MREIHIDTDVFSSIWALRIAGEENENEILRRILSEYSNKLEVNQVSEQREALQKERFQGAIGKSIHFAKTKEVKTSNSTLDTEASGGGTPIGKIRWVDDVREALKSMGGRGGLDTIYREVERRRKSGNRSMPRTLEATIRRTLEDHSSDSANFRGEDLFANIGRGEWALRSALKP